MSIIVGIICQSGIVLASDSQTTYTSPSGDETCRIDTPKINVVEFSDDAVLVAESGEATYSSRAVEIFTELAKGKNLSDYRTAADTAELAIRQLKEIMRQQNMDCTHEELREYILKHGLEFSLMIAHYHNSNPYIFTIPLSTGAAKKCQHMHESIGCGSAIATYILSWFNIGKSFPFEHGMLAAIYTIEEVKKVDPFCRGKTKMAVVAPKMASRDPLLKTKADILRMMLHCEPSSGYAEMLSEIDRQAKAEWSTRMNAVIRNMKHFTVGKFPREAG